MHCESEVNDEPGGGSRRQGEERDKLIIIKNGGAGVGVSRALTHHCGLCALCGDAVTHRHENRYSVLRCSREVP